MQKIAIIDIGSNSVRLVLFEIYKNHSFRVIDDIKESPRLGEGIFVEGLMKESNMDRALEALKLFKSLCDHNEVDKILAFGTAAVRTAKNTSYFLDRVKKECDIDVSVLRGEDEARFSFYGAINSLDIKEGLLIDMGGASCELVHFQNREIKNSISLNFGSLSIMEEFGLKDSISEEKEKLLEESIEEQFAKVLWLKELKDIPLVGVGGTIRNLGKINMEKTKYPIPNLHNYYLAPQELEGIYNLLKVKDLREKQKVEGLAKSRADIISGASFVFSKLVKYANLSGVVISGKGIREGFLYNYLTTRGKEIDDVFKYGLFNVCERYGISKEHGLEIYDTSSEFFEKLKFPHKLEENEKIMKTMSYLCLSGVNVSYYDHDIHSFYMILNSRIDGITHKELLMSALAASQQNKRNTNYDKYKTILNEKDIYEINIYGLLISFAKTFNRLHGKEVSSFKIESVGDNLYMELTSKECIALEIKIAMDSAKRFEKLFGKRLFIQQKEQ